MFLSACILWLVSLLFISSPGTRPTLLHRSSESGCSETSWSCCQLEDVAVVLQDCVMDAVLSVSTVLRFSSYTFTRDFYNLLWICGCVVIVRHWSSSQDLDECCVARIRHECTLSLPVNTPSDAAAQCCHPLVLQWRKEVFGNRCRIVGVFEDAWNPDTSGNLCCMVS